MAKDKVICECECPVCGEIVKFYKLGWTICPQCKSIKAELTIGKWELIKDFKENETT